MAFFAAALAATTGVARAAVDWSGSWNTKWREGGARLELSQSGDHVTGRYPLYGGEVEAVASGRELKGRWVAGPRSGSFVFAMGPDGRTFVGRYDNGEWWTGARTSGALHTLPVDQSDVRETVRTFVQAGNLANAGLVEERGTQAAVLDVGNRPQPVLLNERIRLAQELFDLINLTTFEIWALPDKRLQDQAFTAKLRQAGTDVVLALNLIRHSDGKWFIVAPPDEELGAVRKALLARDGGRPPEPSAFLKLRTARDTMTAFQAAFADWGQGGRERVIETLDTSQLFPATRTYEADLAAQYLKRVLDRVSKAAPQEIPNDPSDRQPYEAFAHPVGSIVIAPTGEGDKVVWRFTPETLRTIRTLYAAVEAMPLADAGVVEPPSSAFFEERRWLRGWAPALMAPAGPLEEWQILAALVGVALCLLLAIAISRLLLAVLRLGSLERTRKAERALRWPLRIAVAAILYKLLIPFFGWPEEVRQFTAPVHAVIIGLFGFWASWYLVELITQGMAARARRTASRVDDIAISLGSGAVRLAIFFIAASYVATQLSIPTNGILAGLGLSGLAVAFASKETLSNVFGAGILVADHPFRKGDVIKAGDIQGTVEHVGIRSTRIRTAEDTQTVVPNGRLSDASIENRGHRTYGLFQTKIRIPFGTTSARVDAFIADLEKLFADDTAVTSGRTVIGIADLEEASIVISASAYLSLADGINEGAVKSRLMLGILREAERENIALGGTVPIAADAIP